jgi:predicted kinase
MAFSVEGATMKLELLVGPIASGKSTYCRKAASEGAIILNDDSIVTAVHGGDYRLYNESLKPLYKSIENTLVCTALAMGQRLVIDRPNHSIRMRRRYIGLAHSFDATVELVMFKRELPEVHGERRFNSDSRGHTLDYWVDVARYHDSIYQPPDKTIEQFDDLIEWNFPKGS